MSIENNLKRIADAQEIIAAKLSEMVNRMTPVTDPNPQVDPVAQAEHAVQSAPQPPAAPSAALNPQNASIPPAPPAAPQPAAAPEAPASPQPPAAAEAPVTLKPEDVNAVLVAEYQRLGATPEAQQRVFGVLGEFGAKGLSDLDPRNFQAIIDKVRGLQ